MLRLFLLVLCLSSKPAAADQWLPLGDQELSVAPGSALDFSQLVEVGPAGKHGWAKVLEDGHIGFERRSIPQRFLIASMGFSKLNGGLPDKAGSERLVQELKRTGYNMVRLHQLDAHLMTGRSKDFDFDPEQFDRLHYLLAQLKETGIYWIVDGLTSNNAAWGDVRPHRWVKKHHAKMDVLTKSKGFAHWATLVERLWGTKNPYTGSAPLQDPAMLGMILVNEGAVGFLAALEGSYPDNLGPLFRDWLKDRYRNNAALKAAWGGELKAKESVDGVVEVPATVRGRGPRNVDFARFVSDLERKSYKAMEAHVRKLGFKGLTTAFDNWPHFGADITRTAVQWVDMHAYHAEASAHGQPGSKISQLSMHDNAASYIRGLTTTRQWGKPFTVTEYGQPFWNRWRHESAALMPAVAAHQGWDAISQYAETPVQFDYGPSPFTRMQAIYPFNVGADPIARGAERLAALLFLRGDVATAKGRIHLHLDAERALTHSAGWERAPESLSKLAFVSAVGLDFRSEPVKNRKLEVSFEMTTGRPIWSGKLDTALTRSGLGSGDSQLAVLRDADIIEASNRTRLDAGVFESDTGEVVFNNQTKQIEVLTAKTVALVLRGGSATTGPLTVKDASGPALFALSALDNQPIAKSKRLLLWVLTDAINSGMKFKDDERTAIKTLGGFPPQVQTVSATLKIATEGDAKLKAWPLSLSGARRQAVSLVPVPGAIELRLDTSKLRDGPALFFEIAAE